MKFSVGAKIASGFALALVALAAIGLTAYVSIRRLIETRDQVTTSHQILERSQLVLSALKDAETGQRGYLITGEARYLDPYTNGIVDVDRALKDLADVIQDQEHESDRPLLQTLRERAPEKVAELAETIALRKDKTDESFKAAQAVVLTDRGKKTMDDIRKAIAAMQGMEHKLLDRRSKDAQDSADRAISTIIYVVPACLVLLSLAGFLLTRNISVPLTRITEAAQRIASGDLAVTLASDNRQDEVGVLARTFAHMSQSLQAIANTAKQIAAGNLRLKVSPQSERDVLGNAFADMVQNLRAIIADIAQSAAVLSASATEIVASTSQLASSSAQTATAVTETTTTVEEVRQTAVVASEKARRVSESAQKASAVSLSGKRVTDDASEGMDRIREQMNSIALNMVRLSEQTQAIEQIITTVDDLAQQSNLLAVNASIEAAKAGEHGKGFGVVAQEVKNLAEQSKQATARVRAILGDIQRATGAAVMSTDQGARAVEVGVKQTAQAGESILALAGSVTEASEAATQIAASSQQQLVGMDQVAQAMESIKQASTQNVESAKQLETAARGLGSLGQRLKDAVERYKV